MFKYVIKRLLLMIPTFLGVTLLVFIILAYVPGGPFERAVMQLQATQMSGGEAGGGGGSIEGSQQLSQEMLEQLKRQYGLNKPLWQRYLIWLGLYPRELKSEEIAIDEAFRDNVQFIKNERGRTFAIQKWIRVRNERGKPIIEESGIGSDFYFSDEYNELPDEDAVAKWYPATKWKISNIEGGKVKLEQKAFSGILTGDFGISHNYSEPVLKLIKDRLHISLYFGIIGFVLSYLVCIPLGIMKAVRHGSGFDLASSIIIFIGYAIPGYVLGALMLVLFGGGSGFLNIFPLGGFHAPTEEWLSFSFFEKVKNQLWHTVLPVIAYMISSFAVLTILMKNSLMDNLGKDYIRTAFAKGLSEKKVIFLHAVRNSLIPIATGIGGLIGVFLAGSYLIELVFNINGIGKLSYDAIVNVDYPVFLGFLVLSVLVLMFGNLISDLCYVLVDPRIKFD